MDKTGTKPECPGRQGRKFPLANLPEIFLSKHHETRRQNQTSKAQDVMELRTQIKKQKAAR